MKTKGKLFFDFVVPAPADGAPWPEAQLELIRAEVEREIQEKDEWRYGNCVRNRWLNLWDVPSDPQEMLLYTNARLADIRKFNVKAEQDPPQPIAYCYSGDSRICYHPQTMTVNGNPWTVEVLGTKIYILIVLTYKTKCFPQPDRVSSKQVTAR